MPNSHFDVKLLSRAKGHSAIAASAYRSGQRLRDDRLGRTFDYRQKQDIRFTEIMLPADAPAWMENRQRLWNAVEAGEKRKDAQLSRAFTAALPRELNLDQQIELVREFVHIHFTSTGQIADVAIHESLASDGLGNPHVHLMLTLRDVDRSGFGKKNREWNAPDLVTTWRHSWESLTNAALEAAGSDEVLSLRSYEEQGIDQVPEFHLGYEDHALEMAGRRTERGDRLRDIRFHNQVKAIAGDLLPEEESWGFDATLTKWHVPDDDKPTPAESYEHAIAAYLGAGIERTVQAASDIAVRVTQWWEQAVEAASAVYDRVTNAWIDRGDHGPPMEQGGMER